MADVSSLFETLSVMVAYRYETVPSWLQELARTLQTHPYPSCVPSWLKGADPKKDEEEKEDAAHRGVATVALQLAESSYHIHCITLQPRKSKMMKTDQ